MMKGVLTVFRTVFLVGLVVFGLVLVLGIVLLCTGLTLGGILCCLVGAVGTAMFGLVVHTLRQNRKGKETGKENREPSVAAPKAVETDHAKTDYGETTTEKRRRQKPKKPIASTVWMCAFVALLVIPGIKAVDICTREQDSIRTVTAYVTKHEKRVDKDGDEKYTSYVSYTVNGKEYTDIRFETANRRSDLAWVGEAVDIEVSLKMPRIPISNLLDYGIVLLVLGVVLLTATFTHGCTVWIRSKCTMGLKGTPDEDMVCRDAKRIIWSNPWNYIFMLLFVIALLCRMRYAQWIGSRFGILVGLMGALLVLFLFRAFRLSARVENRDWELRADELVEKSQDNSYDYKKNRRGRTTYYLNFKSQDKNWSVDTTAENFRAAQEGTYLWAVHLKERKKALFYYDVNGDATKV